MDLEDQRIGQLAHVLKSRFGAAAVSLCDACLARRGNSPTRNCDQDECNCRHSHQVSPDKFVHPIRHGIWSRSDRKFLQVPTDIFYKLFHGAVAAARFFAQRFQNNVVQIATKELAIRDR